MNVKCRVCKGTGEMRALVLIGGSGSGANVETRVGCTECAATGVGGVSDWTPEQVREALRALGSDIGIAPRRAK